MLRFLFPRLTSERSRGSALFDAVVAEARSPDWFIACAVPDTIDGRFDVLSTLLALAILRGEEGGAEANDAAVGLVERFADAMDSEHRQLGVSDPAIGKTVRRLVAMLGKRVGTWRDAPERDWRQATHAALYRGDAVSTEALSAATGRLEGFARRLATVGDADFAEGRIG